MGAAMAMALPTGLAVRPFHLVATHHLSRSTHAVGCWGLMVVETHQP